MTGNQLRKERKRLHLSQFAVAVGAKVSRYNISLFEKGYRKLSDIEETNIEFFLKGVENNVNDKKE